MRIDNLYLVGKMFKNIGPETVRSGRTCPANLGVRSGILMRKLICPVRSSPKLWAKEYPLYGPDSCLDFTIRPIKHFKLIILSLKNP